MTAPIWKTPRGTLGTIQEDTFYSITLEAYVPEGNLISYKIISGYLPPGLILNENGIIKGNPKAQYLVTGVPFNVSSDVTSQWCCRATDTVTGQITDRTFSITVTGEDAPQLITQSQELGRFFDGSYVDLQIEAIDFDNEPIEFKILSGTLPTGLTLNTSTGRITGYVEPIPSQDTFGAIGWSNLKGWDEIEWDLYSSNISKSFAFKVSISDGKQTAVGEYSIFVISKSTLTADNTVTIDPGNDLYTFDLDVRHSPIILTPSGDLGIYAHDNYFAYQFLARDFDGDILEFGITVGNGIGFDNETYGFDGNIYDAGYLALPPGLTINLETGWMYGYLPRQNPAQIEYTFGVQVKKKNYPTYISPITFFTLSIVGDLKYVVEWVTPTDLGSIKAGEISELYVEARNTLGKQLNYYITSGTKSSKLPQGLRVLSDGTIAGRVSFEQTSFDHGKMTFDKKIKERGSLLPEMTIDREYTFTVKVTDIDEIVVAYKSFKLTVESAHYAPYENLYLRAYPGLEDKALYYNIINNTDLIPNEYVYRPSDPNFGKQKNLDLLLMGGITAHTPSDYIQAMAMNHYRKELRFGDVQIARALDENENVKYEVVYLPIIDDEINIKGSSPQSIDLRQKIRKDTTSDNAPPTVDTGYTTISDGNRVIHPNSLINMRNQLRSELTLQNGEILPRWMKSKQSNGKIFNWIPAVVIAYIKPGYADRVRFYLNRLSSYDIKYVSFDVDRYIWDSNLSKNYNASTGFYSSSAETTFDETNNYTNYFIATFYNIADGSTKVYGLSLYLEDKDVDINLYKNINLEDGSTIVENTMIPLVEGVDYTISDYTVTLTEAPEINTKIEINVSTGEVLSADFAVTIPFNSIDATALTKIITSGGFDGIVDNLVGKNIIFALQENYPGFLGLYDGWIQNLNSWDDFDGWDSDSGWDNYKIIPGYFEHEANITVPNQRAGIWRVAVNENGIVTLNFVKEVRPGQTVRIKDGSIYGGKIVQYGPLIITNNNETVPRYQIVTEQKQTVPTTFDLRNTQFIDNISIYEEPDEGDKYLAFPRKNIWG